jgi:hypothetical protein
MPPEFVSDDFISVVSAQVHAGPARSFPRARSQLEKSAVGGPGRVSGRLLRRQEPCRVPAGRPFGPLLTPEPRPARRAGIRGQAGGLPAPRRPAHPQPGPAAAAGRPGWSTTGPGRSGTGPTPRRDPGRTRVVGRCRGRDGTGDVTHAAPLRVSYCGRVTACVCSSVTPCSRGCAEVGVTVALSTCVARARATAATKECHDRRRQRGESRRRRRIEPVDNVRSCLMSGWALKAKGNGSAQRDELESRTELADVERVSGPIGVR